MSNVISMQTRKQVAMPQEAESLPDMLRRLADDIQAGAPVAVLSIVTTAPGGSTHSRRFGADGKILMM